MSLIIFGDAFTFPEGNASTNRVFTYAKGFAENGKSTYVVTLGNDYQNNKEGVIEGIHYHVAFKPVYKCKNFLKRNFPKFNKYFNALKVINQIQRKEPVTAIIVYTKNLTTHILIFFLSRYLGAKLVIENSEHPLRYYRHGAINRIIGKMRLFIELHTFDGILLITQNLMEFYKNKVRNDQKMLLVPSTVDPSRFVHAKSGMLAYEYIGYFGYLNFHRDRLDILLRAFANVINKHPDIHLVMGGALRDEDRNLILDLIEKLQITDKVHLLEYLKRDEVTRYFVDAKILVLVRSDHPDTNASYPSKLTEYLATGNPVISVNVGEIPNYLKNNENAFLFKPNDSDDLIDKLNFVLDNYEFAQKVGQSGKKLTNHIFNYNYQSKRIIEFIESI